MGPLCPCKPCLRFPELHHSSATCTSSDSSPRTRNPLHYLGRRNRQLVKQIIVPKTHQANNRPLTYIYLPFVLIPEGFDYFLVIYLSGLFWGFLQHFSKHLGIKNPRA